jgi:hypothetical protein
VRPAPARIIALGASNLTRGLPTLVSAARAGGGPDVEILAALGLGRSYGMASRVLARTLPGILDSGLWSALADRPPVPTRALVTDVGNDILYGASPPQILAWVAESLDRLRRVTDDIVVAGLPLDAIRALTPGRFLAFRTILFHRCRLTFPQALDASEQVAEGLAALAAARGARFVALRPEWYGLDPVHVRPRQWRAAWLEILGAHGTAGAAPSLAETVRLHALRPERQWLFGIEGVKAQRGARLGKGGRVWLY